MTPQDPQNPEHTDNFDRLLANRSEIAEFVNSFTSERVQRRAFDAVVCSLGLAGNDLPAVPPVERLHIVKQDDPVSDDLADQEQSDEFESVTEKPKRTRSRKPGVKKAYARVKDINFRPEGKVSLRDFWAQKSPANNHERNLAIVYYLEEYLEVRAIEVGHVLSGYDEVGMKSPAIPDNSLMVTASQKGWLDTADMKTIRTTHGGRNVVQYDMPTKKDKTSA